MNASKNVKWLCNVTYVIKGSVIIISPPEPEHVTPKLVPDPDVFVRTNVLIFHLVYHITLTSSSESPRVISYDWLEGWKTLAAHFISLKRNGTRLHYKAIRF